MVAENERGQAAIIAIFCSVKLYGYLVINLEMLQNSKQIHAKKFKLLFNKKIPSLTY